MRWTTKWGILFGLAHLPGGRRLHEWMLRRKGELATLEQSSRFQNAIEIVQTVRRHLGSLEGLTVVELGTGWVPAVPLAFALCGAKVQTYDIRRLTDRQLFHKTLTELRRFSSQLALAANISESQIQERCRHLASAGTLADALGELGGCYVAPADTCALPIESGTVDAVISSLVLQCIPQHLLAPVLVESWRILSSQGVAVHRLRLSDEYAAADAHRNHLEYLKYSQATWERWYNHRLKHQNRLRSSQFSKLFEDAGFESVERSLGVDTESIPRLKEIGVDSSFAQLDWNDLATVSMSVVLKKCALPTTRQVDMNQAPAPKAAAVLAGQR